jgi:hypothetical protein
MQDYQFASIYGTSNIKIQNLTRSLTPGFNPELALTMLIADKYLTRSHITTNNLP